MKKINMIGFILLIFVLAFSNGTNVVFAESNSIPFTVEPILPDNQDKDTKSYISVSSASNTLVQQLQFKLTNVSNETKEIKISIVDAYTSPNGVIQYVNEPSENSEIVNEQYKLSNYLTYERDVISIAKDETKVIATELDVDGLEGSLLGGVSFSVMEEGDEIVESDSTFLINNEINMIIGVLVNFATEQDAVFIMDSPYLDPMPAYYAIRIPLTLDAPILQQDVQLTYEVRYNNETLFENEKNFDFAPYTKTNISLPFEHNEIVPNEEYTVVGALMYENKQGDRITEPFEETFIYEKENDVNTAMNTLSAPIEKGSFPKWPLLLFVIPFVVILYILRKKRKAIDPSEVP